jgi:hypothetical protein
MFVGHLAVALVAKKAEPRVPLAAFVAAVFGADLLWPVFLLLGLEVVRIDPGNTPFTPLDFVSYPWSHSLLMDVLWGALAGWVAMRALGSPRAGVLIGLAVVSHWVLDFASHRPDMPLWPGGPMVGLGLWNSVAATLVVEGAMLAAAVAVYTRAMPARDGTGRWAFWGLLAVCIGAWISGPFSPPPPSVTAIVVVGLVMAAVLPLWAAWIDRHRRSAGGRR